MLEMILQWLVRTALSTSDTLCGSFHRERRQQREAYPLHRRDQRRNGRGCSGSDDHPSPLPPFRKISYADEESSDDEDGEIDHEQNLELRMKTRTNTLCMGEVWSGSGAPLVAEDLVSLVPTASTSAIHKIPNEVVVDSGRQSPVSLLFQSHYAVPPRPLSRTAPPPPYSSPCLSNIGSARTCVSSLGCESAPLIEEKDEEEDSILDGLVEFQRTWPPLPPPISRTPGQTWTSAQSSLGLSFLSSPILPPPITQRKWQQQSVTSRNRPSYSNRFATTENDTFPNDWKIEKEEDTNIFEWNRQDEVHTDKPLADFLVSEASSSCPSKEQQAAAAHRDPPEKDEGASTALFTYSTQDSTTYQYYQDEAVEAVITRSDKPMSVSTVNNRQKFADGSSYSHSSVVFKDLGDEDNDDYSVGCNDADIVNAALAVKSMLIATTSPKQLQRLYSTDSIPTIHRGHWFLPPLPSSASRGAVSTPSQSTISARCQDENSV